MKLTKYEHSCFTLEKGGKILVIDPGAWAGDFVVPENVVGVFVSHEHADHFDPDKLAAIYDKNPESLLIAHKDITDKMPDHISKSVSVGDRLDVGPFRLEFVGGTHATIHKDFHPPFVNLGVIVDDTLYHPGDSLFIPDQPIKVLSLPITAPWEKASDSMDFLITIKPELAFPTHDAILSELGVGLYDRWHKLAAEEHGIRYERVSGSIEI